MIGFTEKYLIDPKLLNDCVCCFFVVFVTELLHFDIYTLNNVRPDLLSVDILYSIKMAIQWDSEKNGFWLSLCAL